jgi:hypothetical protein
MYGAIDPQVYFDNPDPTGFVEALSNDDLFNTQVLNRTIKNIYENEAENFSFMNAYLSNYGVKGNCILTDNVAFDNHGSFSIEGGSDFTEYTINIDKLGGTTNDRYLRVPPGILVLENNSTQKVFNIRPQTFLIERQIRKALILYKVISSTEKENVEIKYSLDSDLFICKISKIVNKVLMSFYFGCDETSWNNSVYSSGFTNSIALIVAINNYQDSYVDFRGDLYNAVSGNLEIYKCEQTFFGLQTDKIIFFDKDELIFKSETTINGAPISLEGSYDRRFCVNVRGISSNLLMRPIIDITPLNNTLIESIGNYPFTTSGFVVEDFQIGTLQRKGFRATSSSDYIQNTGTISNTQYPIISFNVYIPSGSSGAILQVKNLDLTDTYINVVDEGSGFFSLSTSYSSSTNYHNIFILCDGELAGIGLKYSASSPGKTKAFEYGYHHILIAGLVTSTFEAISPIIFKGIADGYKINEIKIFNGSKYIISTIYYPNLLFKNDFDLIRGLMALDSVKIRTNSDEVFEDLTVTNSFTVKTEYYGTSGQDVRKGLTISQEGKDLVLSPGMYSKYDNIIQEEDFTNTWNGYSEVSNTPLNRFESMTMSSDGNFILACHVDEDYLYLSKDSGKTWQKKVNSGLKVWKKVLMNSDASLMMAIAEPDTPFEKIYYSKDYGETWSYKLEDGNPIDIAMSLSGQYQIKILDDSGAKDSYFSSDYGFSWSHIPITTPLYCDISESGQYVIIGESSLYIYYSDDYGASFTSFAPTGATGNWNVALAYKEGKYIVLYALNTTSNIIYASYDIGTTWVQMLNGDSNAKIISKTKNGITINNYTNTESFSIFPNYYLSSNIIFDGNENPATRFNFLTDHNFVSNFDGTVLYARNSLVFYKSINSGKSWTNIGTQFSGTGGTQYGKMSCSYTGQRVILERKESNFSKVVHYSNDYGETFNISNCGLSSYICYSGFSCSEDGMIVAVVLKDAYSPYTQYTYVSIDGGANFNDKSLNGKTAVAVSADGNYIYAAGNSSVHMSIDDGDTWNDKSTGLVSPSYISCDSTGSIVIVADSGGYTYKSINNGTSWTAGTISKSWSSIRSNYYGNFFIATTSDNKIWFSYDGLNTWHDIGYSSNSYTRPYFSGDLNSVFIVQTSPNSNEVTHYINTSYFNGIDLISSAQYDNGIYLLDTNKNFRNEIGNAILKNPVEKTWACFAMSDYGHILLCEQNGYSFLSDDYGETYTELTWLGQKDWRSAHITKNGSLMVISNYDGTAYISYNYGKNFFSINTGVYYSGGSYIYYTLSSPVHSLLTRIGEITGKVYTYSTVNSVKRFLIFYRSYAWKEFTIPNYDWNSLSISETSYNSGSWNIGAICSDSEVYSIHRGFTSLDNPSNDAFTFTSIKGSLPSGKTWKLISTDRDATSSGIYICVASTDSIYIKYSFSSSYATDGTWKLVTLNNSFSSIKGLKIKVPLLGGDSLKIFVAHDNFIGIGSTTDYENFTGVTWEKISYENFDNNGGATWSMAETDSLLNYIVGVYTDTDVTNRFIHFKKENQKILYANNLFKDVADNNTWKYITGNDVEEVNEETTPSTLPISNFFWDETLSPSHGHYFNNSENKRIFAAISKSSTIDNDYKLYTINCLEDDKKVGNNENGYFVMHNDGKLEVTIPGIEITTSETETPSSLGIGLTCYAGSAEKNFPIKFIDKDIQIDINKDFGSVLVSSLTEEKIKLSIEASVPGSYVYELRATGKWK